jgi:diguanylate cyclase (GGDEF)-like protein
MLLTGIGLAIAGASIFFLVRGFIEQQQRQTVARHARFIAQVVLANELRPSDFSHPDGARRAALERIFRRQVVLDDFLGGALYSSTGRVTFSSDSSLLGTTTVVTPGVIRALSGMTIPVFVRTVHIHGVSRRALAEIVPVRFSRGPAQGAVVLWADDAAISRAAQKALIPIAIVLPALLVALLAGLVPMLRRATRQIRSHLDDSEYEALHDGLTGLPNRTLFEDRVRLAISRSDRAHDSAAVMLLDLNRFKEVNDTLGHAAGDTLLREVAARVGTTLRGADTVARLGGDEFAVVLGDVELGDAEETATRIHEALAEPMVIEGLAISVGASIGIALYPAHGDSVSDLLQHADVAMYESKQDKTPYVIYNPVTDTNNAERLSLTTDLHSAIARRELSLVYQPTLDLRTGNVVGVEALLRWQHPTLGLLSADHFIPLAENVGLADDLSEWALGEAIRQCGEWTRSGLELTVGVNIDGRSLVDLDFPARIRALLEAHGVDASRIELEITETSIMTDPVRVRRVATLLAELGVSLAIDDFGTGYSSLSYLSRLPISKLKIDRSFVSRMESSERDAIIVGATVELAHNLGLLVVAEGIEDADRLETLRALGADLAQGHFIGAPVGAASTGFDLREERAA